MIFYIKRGDKLYPYHNKIKKRIKNGELVNFEFGNYPRIGECLILYFNTMPYKRPIRPHKYVEYVDILEDWKRSVEK